MAFNYDDYYALEYIESSGTQYIDTGLSDINGYQFIGKARLLTGLNTSAYTYLFGRGYSNHHERLEFRPTPMKFYANVGNRNYIIDKALTLNTDFNFLLDGRLRYYRYGMIDSTESAELDTTMTIQGINSYLFCQNYSGSGARNFTNARLYDLQITDNNGIEVSSLLPAMRKSDNAVGMYDIVRESWYPNAGTGTFVAGPIVPAPQSDNIVKLKVNGTWKDAKPYIKVNGSWKEATPYLKVNGSWKETVS